jgi:hypothetical protein
MRNSGRKVKNRDSNYKTNLAVAGDGEATE